MLIRNSSVIMRVKFDPLRIEELPNSDDMTGSELAERMEICPSIPMFDLAGLATLAQWHGQQERGEGEEVPEGPVENEVRRYN